MSQKADVENSFGLDHKTLTAFRVNNPLIIEFYTLSEEIEQSLEIALSTLLKHLDRLYLKDFFYSVSKELIINALKANIKRAYFLSKHLSILNQEDYSRGMSGFRKEVFDDVSLFKNELHRQNFKVRLTIAFDSKRILLTVRNNCPLTIEEEERIRNKLALAQNIQDLTQVFPTIKDDAEGAGLGLILIILMMKNEGISAENLEIKSRNGSTEAVLSVPMFITKSGRMFQLCEEILKTVDQLPSFPDDISRIQNAIRKEDATIEEIAKLVQLDVSISADVLKLANSVGYITRSRAETIEEAIRIIGLERLNDLLYLVGVQSVMGREFKKIGEIENVWKHSYQTARFAHRISKELKLKNTNETAFLAGLLHDMGRIVMLACQPELSDEIFRILGRQKDSSVNIIEEITIGISHATIGSIIAKQWNFPKPLIKAIEFHHRPFLAEEQYKDLIYVVYLANILSNSVNEKLHYENIEPLVLHEFGLNSKERFQLFARKILESN